MQTGQPFRIGAEGDGDLLDRERFVLQILKGLAGLVDALAGYPGTARLLMRALVEEDPLGPDLPEAIAAEGVLEGILDGIRTLLDEGVKSGVFRDLSAFLIADRSVPSNFSLAETIPFRFMDNTGFAISCKAAKEH